MTYAWLKLLHVLFVLLLAVGDVGSLLAAIRARRATSVRETLTLMRMHHFTVMTGIIPGAIGSLVTGGALVAMAGFSWGDLWIAGTAGGWIGSLLVGVGILIPAENAAIREAERQRAAGDDAPSVDLRRHVGAPRVWIGEWTTVVLLVLMSYFMVLKPR
jgi:uncharacterized membrane protein